MLPLPKLVSVRGILCNRLKVRLRGIAQSIEIEGLCRRRRRPHKQPQNSPNDTGEYGITLPVIVGSRHPILHRRAPHWPALASLVLLPVAERRT